MSDADIWTGVDRYIEEHVIGSDEALSAAIADSAREGLPPIAVSAAQGKLLHVLARSIGAHRILEIGTLGGYSTIWMGSTLPDGAAGHSKLISLELDPHHTDVARANVARAGLGSVVEIRVGAALDSLPKLAEEISEGTLFGGELFDLIFVDADKANIPSYFDWSVKFSRPGGLIVVDNVVRHGQLADPNAGGSDPNVEGVRRLHEQISKRTDVSATTIQTVGAKGYDGFTIAVVN